LKRGRRPGEKESGGNEKQKKLIDRKREKNGWQEPAKPNRQEKKSLPTGKGIGVCSLKNPEVPDQQGGGPNAGGTKR